MSSVGAPLGMLAELTHRCPLGCPYCSNPLALDRREDELDSETWARVFGEAAALGVLQVHLSGGEPGARRDLVEIAASAREAGLYTNLITSGVGITARTMRDLVLDLWASPEVTTKSILLVTHSIEEAVTLSDRVVVLKANPGRIVDSVDLRALPRPRRADAAPVRETVDRMYGLLA